MKIRRFVAADMKTALAQIKEELGADAVIMSNKKIVEGVEIMAAVDYYPSTTEEKTAPNASATPTGREIQNDVVNVSSQKQTPVETTTESEQLPADSLSALLNRKVQQEAVSQKQVMSQKEPAPQTFDRALQQQEVRPSNDDIELQFKNFTDRLEQSTQQRNNEQVAEQQISLMTVL